MKGTTLREVAVGLFVLAGLAGLAYLSLGVGGLSLARPAELVLHADFDGIGGLRTRAPVKISGVTVGRVAAIELTDDFRARVSLAVDADLELPVDSSASILTAGLLGDQYVALLPGAEDEVLGDGDPIGFTESALQLERLIGHLIHNTDVAEE